MGKLARGATACVDATCGHRGARWGPRLSLEERLAERRSAARAARLLAPRPYRNEPLKRIKAKGGITWLMHVHGDSGDYLRCGEHNHRFATTEDYGFTAAS
jgi:hypothetical protein